MNEKVFCLENECNGEINLDNPVILQTGCRSACFVYPCQKCGRLHFSHGQGIVRLVFNRGNKKTYFIDGKIVHK